MAMIKGYPEGSNITILNAKYHKSRKDEMEDKWLDDNIVITFRDNNTGEKHHQTIYNPDYIYYKLNDDVPVPPYNLFSISKNKVHPVTCKYRQLLKSIAEETGNLDFFYENISHGNYRNNKMLHTDRRVFGTDIDIEDHYRARFAQEYQNPSIRLNLAYMDIETDIKVINNRFPDMGQVPINAVTYIDDRLNTCNVFLLRNPNNPLIEKFEQEVASGSILFKELKEFVISAVGGKENAEKYRLNNIKYNFYFFDDEKNLLCNLFRLINSNSPDFMLAWNMAFDIPYIIQRCVNIGLDPAEVMSDKSHEEKYAYPYIDTKHKNSYEARGDYYDIGSDTVYIDQLIQFASRRKGQAAFPNFKLDTAADVITKGAVRKLDYSHIVSNLGDLPYVDYKTFVFYNIMDVVNQRCIELSVHDIDYLFKTAIMSDVRYSKAHRQTVYLGSNMTRKYFFNQGRILGNNTNIDYTKPFKDEEEKQSEEDKFAGAMVGDPEHNSDYAKLVSDDQVLNVANNCDDFDAKAMYPSIDREYNLAPDNIIGKVVIKNKIHKYENPYHDEKYDRGGQFMEDLITGNPLEFGKRWLGLAGVEDLISDIIEYQETHASFIPLLMNNCGNKMIKPVSFLAEGELIKPISIYTEEDEKSIAASLSELKGR